MERNCGTCRFSCSLISTGEFCEDCINGHCIYCMKGICNEYQEDSEVSKYIKEQLDTDEINVRALYNLNENIFDMKLTDFKKLIKLLNKGGI